MAMDGADIKRSEAKLKAYKELMTTTGIKTVKTKAMKMGNYEELEMKRQTFGFNNSEKKMCP